MTQTTVRIAAIALSALMSLAIVAGVTGIAHAQAAVAAEVALAADGPARVAVQHVTVIGHRATA